MWTKSERLKFEYGDRVYINSPGLFSHGMVIGFYYEPETQDQVKWIVRTLSSKTILMLDGSVLGLARALVPLSQAGRKGKL